MTKFWQFVWMSAGLLILVAALGCAHEAPRPIPPRATPPAISAPMAAHPSPSLPGSSPALVGGAVEPLETEAQSSSTDQLRSAAMELEAFRVFCTHFKIQADQATLDSMKKPTLDYIKMYIGPILAHKHTLSDNAHSMWIVSIYYLKAYLLWIFNDPQAAQDIATELSRNIPEALKTKTIYHLDQGSVAVEKALKELEQRIADSHSALSTGGKRL